MLLILVVIFVLIALLDYVLKIKRLWGYGISGPSFIPILGNGHKFAFLKPSEFLRVFWKMCYQSGPFTRFWLANELTIAIHDPNYIEPLLNNSSVITKSNEYTFMKNWLGDGLLLTTGKKWHVRRKIMTPAFHYGILENFVKIVDKHSRTFVNKIEQFEAITPVDVCKLCNLFSLDVIWEATMGDSLDVQLNKNSEYIDAIHEITEIIFKRMYNIFLRVDFIYRLSPIAMRERKIVKIIKKWTDQTIEKRRVVLLKQMAQEKNHENSDIVQKNKMILLDILLQTTVDGQPLSNEDIREEVSTFTFAGHDTTASGLEFLLYNIACNPEVQEKIVEEIRSITGMTFKEELSFGELKNFTYLECVIKESLRLFPPVPMIARHFKEKTQLKDICIPANSAVFAVPLFMGRDPNLFPDPETFKPERFLEDDFETIRNPYTYIPFSAGLRNCIGQKFALLEMKILTVRILQKFKISVDPSYDKPQLSATLVLRSENGILLNFHRRI